MQIPSVFSLYSARAGAVRSRLPANLAGFAGEYASALEDKKKGGAGNLQEFAIIPDAAAQALQGTSALALDTLNTAETLPDEQTLQISEPAPPESPPIQGAQAAPQAQQALPEDTAAFAQAQPVLPASRPAITEPRLYAPPARSTSGALPLYIPRTRASAYYASSAGAAGLGQRIVDFAKQFVGMPYVAGGEDLSKGVDCSGFTQSVFKHFGIELPRSANSQSKVGVQVDPENLQPGDLLFFKTANYAPVTHVAIYMGGGKIVEAANSKLGVITSNLGKDWETRKHFVIAKRMIS